MEWSASIRNELNVFFLFPLITSYWFFFSFSIDTRLYFRRRFADILFLSFHLSSPFCWPFLFSHVSLISFQQALQAKGFSIHLFFVFFLSLCLSSGWIPTHLSSLRADQQASSIWRPIDYLNSSSQTLAIDWMNVDVKEWLKLVPTLGNCLIAWQRREQISAISDCCRELLSTMLGTTGIKSCCSVPIEFLSIS